MPAGAWPHIFSGAGRLPHLQQLILESCWEYSGQAAHITEGVPAGAPEGSVLASCCPGLHRLDLLGMRWTAEQLGTLTALSGLRTLTLHQTTGAPGTTKRELNTECAAAVEAVGRLTGLRCLHLWRIFEGPPLHLTQLRQLTGLSWSSRGRTYGIDTCRVTQATWTCKVSSGLLACLGCVRKGVLCVEEVRGCLCS